jgi:aflatoxin B1 aldehyde reductase
MKNFENFILGTMNFGEKVDLQTSHHMINAFLKSGNNSLDTAYVYNDGHSETMIGEYITRYGRDKIRIATKVNPRVTGRLNRTAILSQLEESLGRLKTSYVDVLYIHFPDMQEPLENILQVCNDLYVNGKIKALGLSNFSADMVIEACEYAIKNSILKPTIYEGMYNAFARKVETDLFAVLRKYNMSFYAYNPLAGGLLTGKYTKFEESPETGRFVSRPNYKKRYWNEVNFKYVNVLNDVCKKYSISLVEASLRWLAYHSMLDNAKGDSIIIGASKINHLENNIKCLTKGPLPSEMVVLYSEAWKNVEKYSPEYYRYSSIKKGN